LRTAQHNIKILRYNTNTNKVKFIRL